jgi:glucose/arabinose dehydrogenase
MFLMLKLTASIAALGVLVGSTFAAPPTALTTVRIAAGLSSPVYATASPGDESRIFIVEQAGRIRILKNGTLNASAFLDIATPKVLSGGERGLLGLAFHPAYATNGFFFVYYTRKTDGALVVERFTRITDDTADPNSGTVVFGPVAHPTNSNHNGGCIQFGPDGYLYIGTGDGGGRRRHAVQRAEGHDVPREDHPHRSRQLAGSAAHESVRGADRRHPRSDLGDGRPQSVALELRP